MFSGSYLPEDVTFLLKVIDIPTTDIRAKERLIQNGTRHYSEMISREYPPSAQYLELFHQACKQNNARFAANLVTLARNIAESTPGEITLVSLARAGTPVGVLLNRIIREYLHRDVSHYSISIIRDRGIDEIALRHILQNDGHTASSIFFIDGWTGKGVIAQELATAITGFNQKLGTTISPALYVVADLSGTAGVAATSDDYLIPSSILNSVISGLISRSILNAEYIDTTDFHGCLYYQEFNDIDLSRNFVDAVMKEVQQLPQERWTEKCHVVSTDEQHELHKQSKAFINQMKEAYNISSIHHIKPGIGEATRVLLRRVPDRLLVRDAAAVEVAHLIQLADEKKIPCEEIPSLAYSASAIIHEMD
jgi:hypothetical protein